jgi:putative flippase GtrA
MEKLNAALGLVRQAVRTRGASIPRPVRFVAVGGASSLLQFVFLVALVTVGFPQDPANAVAFLISTQVNFMLSSAITWRDRSAHGLPSRTVARRLLSFNGMAVTTLVINETIFALALLRLPYLAAGALGILVAAPISYLVSHRLIFVVPSGRRSHGRNQTRQPLNSPQTGARTSFLDGVPADEILCPIDPTPADTQPQSGI